LIGEKEMIKDLKEQMDKYSLDIKTGFPDYTAIYSYFVDYINNVLYKSEDFTLQEFLSSEFSRRTLMKSCAHYCENSNATRITAIEKYLNAMTKFYTGYMLVNGYENRNLSNIQPFAKLKKEVNNFIKDKKLSNKQAIPPISDADYIIICDYLNNIKKPTIIQKQISIIFKLLMLYGLKFERIAYLEKEDYDYANRKLTLYDEDDSKITVNVPASLSLEIVNYINSPKCNKTKYMFLTRNNKIIKSSFLAGHFKRLKKLYNISSDIDNYTSTGMAKYGIIKMLEEEMNVPVIKMVTGMEEDVLNDCTRIFYKLDEIDEINRYINATLRSIKNYDELDKIYYIKINKYCILPTINI
jgi:hypothetical protein